MPKPIEPGCLARTVMPDDPVNHGIYVKVLGLSIGNGLPLYRQFEEYGTVWTVTRPGTLWGIQALSRPFNLPFWSGSKAPINEIYLERIDDIDDNAPDTLTVPLPSKEFDHVS